jgi:hypothetical protein
MCLLHMSSHFVCCIEIKLAYVTPFAAQQDNAYASVSSICATILNRLVPAVLLTFSMCTCISLLFRARPLLHAQRSYYTPVAKRYGPVAGSAAAFTVSGLFHEFMFGTMLFWGAPVGVYRFGEVLVFFLLMFVMCCAPWWNSRKLTQVRPCICCDYMNIAQSFCEITSLQYKHCNGQLVPRAMQYSKNCL